MRKFIALAALATVLILAMTTYSEAAGPARFGVGVGLQRARVLNPGFRAVNAVRGLGLGLGGFGYNRSLGFGLGGYGGYGGYGHSAAFVQPFCSQQFVQPYVQQSYSLVQPVQAFTQVQAVVAQPVFQQQVYSQALGVNHCNGVQALGVGGCGIGAQAIIGGGYGQALGFRSQPILRQRFGNPRIQGFRY